jgi:hypothetical protein
MKASVGMALTIGALLLPAAAADAGPKSDQKAFVTLGDSYISGEAGRWKGNSETTSGDSAGTDRAWTGSAADLTKVYLDGSDTNGCHRSDVAEARSAMVLGGATAINLACSGSETINVLRKSQGGVPYKDAKTQGDQLVDVLDDYDVQAIVLSIGGNDLGFGDAAQDCVLRYFRGSSACRDTAQKQIDARLQPIRRKPIKPKPQRAEVKDLAPATTPWAKIDDDVRDAAIERRDGPDDDD